MQEKKAIELLKEAWVLLDIVEPNNPVTDKIFEFLTPTTEETEMEKLVAWLEKERDYREKEMEKYPGMVDPASTPKDWDNRMREASFFVTLDYVLNYITTPFGGEEG